MQHEYKTDKWGEAGLRWLSLYITFSKWFLLINESYKKAVSCSASALSAMKRKPSLSHTQRWIEKCSVVTHTSLPGRISVPNIWALSLLKACGLLSPCLICVCGRERLNRKRPPYRVGLRSLSIGAVSPGAEGISIDAKAQRKEKETEWGIFIWKWDLCVGRGSPPPVLSGNLTSWINRGFVWNYITFPRKWKRFF